METIDSLFDEGAFVKQGQVIAVLDASVLKKNIEEELFELSEAHYQRYFKVEKFFNV